MLYLAIAWLSLDSYRFLRCLVSHSHECYPVLACLHSFREIRLDRPLRLALILPALILASLLNMLAYRVSKRTLCFLMYSNDLPGRINGFERPILYTYRSFEGLTNFSIDFVIVSEQSLRKSSLVRRGHLRR